MWRCPMSDLLIALLLALANVGVLYVLMLLWMGG